jgi:HPt (histidine-containing phosphotransfer) domain-containing protein
MRSRGVQFTELHGRSDEVASMKKENAKKLDRAEFLDRVEQDEELARELLGIFQTDTAANRESLHAAVQARNLNGVRDGAHAFKGMLANLSANLASAAAAHLELLAKEGKSEELADAWHAFDTELSGVLVEIEHLLAGAPQ